MNKQEVDAYCVSLPAVTTDYQPEWDADRFFIGGKMFAMTGILEKENNRPIVILKCDPDESMALRQEYEDVIPGYHMNKQHWITIFLDRDSVPQSVIESCLQSARQLVFQKLTKKAQKEIELNPNFL